MHFKRLCGKFRICDLSIKYRFMGFFAVVLSLIILIIFIGEAQLDRNQATKEATYEVLSSLYATQQIKTCVLEQYSLTKDIVLDEGLEHIGQYKKQYIQYQQTCDSILNSLINNSIHQDSFLVLKKAIYQWNTFNREVISHKENDETKNLKIVLQNSVIFQKEYVLAYLEFLIGDFVKKGTLANTNAKKTHETIHFSLFVFVFIFLSSIIAYSQIGIHTIFKPLKNLIQGVREITNHNLELTLDVHRKDEIGLLADAIGKLQQRLIDRNNEIAKSNAYGFWLKLGQTGLYEHMRGETNVHRLSEKIIAYLSQYIEAQAGVLYLYYKHPQQLKLAGVYAISNENVPELINIGQGVLGQAALDKQAFIVNNLQEDYFKTCSGIVELSLKHVLVVPFLYEDRVIGVLEIASYKEITQKEFDFVKTISEDIAVVLKSTIIKKRSIKGKRNQLRITN